MMLKSRILVILNAIFLLVVATTIFNLPSIKAYEYLKDYKIKYVLEEDGSIKVHKTYVAYPEGEKIIHGTVEYVTRFSVSRRGFYVPINITDIDANQKDGREYSPRFFMKHSPFYYMIYIGSPNYELEPYTPVPTYISYRLSGNEIYRYSADNKLWVLKILPFNVLQLPIENLTIEVALSDSLKEKVTNVSFYYWPEDRESPILVAEGKELEPLILDYLNPNNGIEFYIFLEADKSLFNFKTSFIDILKYNWLTILFFVLAAAFVAYLIRFLLTSAKDANIPSITPEFSPSKLVKEAPPWVAEKAILFRVTPRTIIAFLLELVNRGKAKLEFKNSKVVGVTLYPSKIKDKKLLAQIGAKSNQDTYYIPFDKKVKTGRKMHAIQEYLKQKISEFFKEKGIRKFYAIPTIITVVGGVMLLSLADLTVYPSVLSKELVSKAFFYGLVASLAVLLSFLAGWVYKYIVFNYRFRYELGKTSVIRLIGGIGVLIFILLLEAVTLSSFFKGEIPMFYTTSLANVIFVIKIFILLLVNVYFAIGDVTTKDGAQVIAHYLGIREFITRVEEDRIKRLAKDNPKETLKILFEFLPYAVALNILGPWKKVAKQISKHIDLQQSYDHVYGIWGITELSDIEDISNSISDSLTSIQNSISSGIAAYQRNIKRSYRVNSNNGGGFSGGGSFGGGTGGW